MEQPSRDAGERAAREQEYWDQAYEDASRAAARKYYEIGERRRALYTSLVHQAAGPGSQVMEIGCGSGGVAFDLAAAGAHVTGIDISPVAIEQARVRADREGVADRTDFRVMNAEALEIPTGSLDLVCGTAVIHHLDLALVFPEIVRVLKPSGSAIFTEPLGHNPIINAYRRITPRMRTVDEHPLVLEDLEQCEQHWRGVEVHYFHLASLLAVPLLRTPLFRPVVGVLDGVDKLLFRIPASRRHAWYIVVRLTDPR